MKRLSTAFVLALLPALSQGAEPADPAPAAAPAPAVTAQMPPKDAPAPAASAAEEAAATRKANERFDPSEKISEDLSVSFPADI